MDPFSMLFGAFVGGFAVAWLRDRQQASAARRVADRALILAQAEPFHAFDFMREHGWRPVRFYPLIDRMEDAGEVEGWFETDPPAGKRPRRFYRVRS